MTFFYRLVLLLLITLVAIASFFGCSQEQQNPSLPTPEELSQESQALDKTLWAKEVLAQKYEETFIHLWDNLRTSEDKYETLKNFKFGHILFGERNPSTNFEWNIRQTKFSKIADKPAKKLSHQQWETFLDNVKNRGFRIRQSEWHHSTFIPPQDDKSAQSVVSFEIHLSHTARQHRIILKGKLAVEWASIEGKYKYPLPNIIDASEVQLWEQVGDPIFKMAGKFEQKPPYPNAPASIVPLAVYDLNGDHLPEILFGGSNSVLWNKGNFKFDISPLFNEDVWMDNSGVIGDFTGDGIVDYLGVNHKLQACLLAGSIDGKFREKSRQCWPEKIESPSSITAGDVDGDHLPEILFGGSNSVLWNKGNFKFDISPLFNEDVWMDNSGVIGDFTGDGIVDYLGVNHKLQACLLAGSIDGKFREKSRQCWPEKIESPSSITAGDVDGDGDLDVWVAQYKPPYIRGQMPTPYYDANDGFPSYLFLNDGKGNFTDNTEAAGLAAKRFRRTYSSSFYDLDNDNDLDLMVVSDFSGLDLYKNDGKGQFREATKEFVEEHHAFGMSHTFGDFDRDGRLDFYMVGMNSTTAKRLDRLDLHHSNFLDYSEKRPLMTYGNRLYQARDNRYVQTSLNNTVAKAGWAWGSSAFDFDNDADDDIYVANGHISGESAKDYCTRYWTHDVYVGDSQERPEIAEFLTDNYRPLGLQGLRNGKISWNGYEHNKLFMNLQGKAFAEIGFLADVGFEFDSRAVITADLDLDGRQDLLVIENKWKSTANGILPNETLYLLKNQLSTDYHWIGVHLANQNAASPIGAKVRIQGDFGSREKRIVTGDSHYSQHPPTVHFGLANTDQIDLMEIQWQNGRIVQLKNPAIDRYHTIESHIPTALDSKAGGSPEASM